jgi:hypothetical protein
VADWATISSLATAGGTLVLATATFASVRSANRSARVAETALQEQRRPVLVHSHADDHAESIGYADGHRVVVAGGGATIEAANDVVYVVLSLRNMGAGIAVLQAWYPHAVLRLGPTVPPPAVEDFRPLTRDQYISSGDVGLLQAAVRDAADPAHGELTAAIAEARSFTIDLLYTDQVGGQRTISRFGVLREGDGWLAAASRHWYLDAAAPR